MKSFLLLVLILSLYWIWANPRVIEVQGMEIVEEEPVRILATVTAYTARPEETDDTPDIVASGKRAEIGMIACPSYLEFGGKVLIDNIEYECQDRMARRFRNGHYFDILMGDLESARQFGRQIKEVILK